MESATIIRRIAPLLTVLATTAVVAPLGAGELAVVAVAALCLALFGAILGRLTHREPRAVQVPVRAARVPVGRAG
jgi:positive regulator of sigma E activity